MKKRAVLVAGRVEEAWAEIDRCKRMLAAVEITERDLARLRAE